MSNNSNTLVLRNYPDDDALKHPENYPKALSFSPDIIPLYGTTADQNELVHSASLRGFTGMPIVGGDVNNVYIRGYGFGGPYIATLRAFPSELVLWPQVWSTVDAVSSGPVIISGGDATDASDDHLSFRPPHAMGNAYSLVANVFKHIPENAHKDLKEYEPIPPVEPVYNGVEDFLAFLSKDKNFTFYNVVVADPTLNHISTSTRLRMFSKSPVSVILRVEKSITIPAEVEVSLVDDRGRISIPRAPLSSLGDYKTTLDRSYDGILTLHIFSPAEHTLFEPYSCLSLNVFACGVACATPVTAADPKLPVPPVQSPQLLGALNVIFDPHSTRNLRFASSSAAQLRESKGYSGKGDCQCHDDKPVKEKCVAIPVTRPATTGWWFRAHKGNTNHFPRTGPAGHSPDIQPVGTDLTAPGLWTALQDPDVDYSDNHQVGLVGGKDNYIFVRGHSTMPDIDVQSRLFAVKGSPMLHPSEYTTKAISAQVFDGSGKVDYQSISVASSNQFYLFNKPFDIKAPPNPNPGNTKNRQHYCLIAEVRQKRKCSPTYPSWPSERGEDFKTMQDFSNWVLSCPYVCFRNISWAPCKPGEKILTWQCSTRLIIPDGSSACSFFTIIIECCNLIIPAGSKWTLLCDDNQIFPRGLCFENQPVGTYAGCHFTGGIPGSATSNLTLLVNWNDNGKNFPLPSVKIRLAATQVATLSPIKHLCEEPPAGSEAWPFYVGNKYPYIGNTPNPSPLPTFNSIGPNAWPYSGSLQCVLGQVAFSAKAE